MTRVLMWTAFASFWASGATFILFLANRVDGWYTLAAFASMFVTAFGTHLAREIHLDGRLPRIGNFRDMFEGATQSTQPGFYDPNEKGKG